MFWLREGHEDFRRTEVVGLQRMLRTSALMDELGTEVMISCKDEVVDHLTGKLFPQGQDKSSVLYHSQKSVTKSPYVLQERKEGLITLFRIKEQRTLTFGESRSYSVTS
jgi:hypothetical protein